MSDWPVDPGDEANGERIALDSDTVDDLDEALQEAVEAVEAAQSGGRGDVVETKGASPATRTPGGEETDVEGLRAELEDLRSRSTRNLADFDNYRKRVEREAEAQRLYDGMEVLRGLLDIVDNLERALQSDGPVDDLKTGVELTLRQAQDLLRRHGVSRIDAEAAVFDPSVHEAVSREEREGLEEPQVTAVLQSGYRMHERLLRPVRVTVAVPVAGAPAPTEDEKE